MDNRHLDYPRDGGEDRVMGVLDGRVAIVTGAGAGLGRGIAQELADAGAGIAVLEVDADLFEAKNALLDAQVQFRRALLELEMIEGTLLKTRNLDLTQRELESQTALLLRKGTLTDEQYADFIRQLQWQYQQKASLDSATEERARRILRQSEQQTSPPPPTVK